MSHDINEVKLSVSTLMMVLYTYIVAKNSNVSKQLDSCHFVIVKWHTHYVDNYELNSTIMAGIINNTTYLFIIYAYILV